MYLLVCRSSKREATCSSPVEYELYFARGLKLPLDLLRGSPPEEERESLVGSYIRKLKRKLQNIHENARDLDININFQTLRSKTRYERKVRQIHFKVGKDV